MSLTNLFRFLSLLFLAVTLAAGLAHTLKLPGKITLSAEDYLTVQQIYRGWDSLGIAFIGALISTLALTVLVRKQHRQFYLTLTAASGVLLSLAAWCCRCSWGGKDPDGVCRARHSCTHPRFHRLCC